MSTASVVYAAGLAGITGYTNVICLLRYAAYATMMTGNILMAANAVTTGNISHAHDGNVFPDLLFYMLIIVAHYCGLFLHSLVSMQQMSYTMLINGPIVLVYTFVTEYMSANGTVPERWATFPVALCFGLQSAVTHQVIGFATILATGHLNNLFACLNAAMIGGGMAGKKDQIKVNFAIIYSLVVGALVGAWVSIHVEQYVFTQAVAVHIGLLLAVERASVSQKLLAASDSATQLVNMDP
jgi:hypothetical protein